MNQIIELPVAPLETPVAGLIPASVPAVRTDAVYVLFTSIDDTMDAVRVADGLARAMDVPLTLVHFRTIPYALPVDRPTGLSPVETQWFAERLRAEGLAVRVRVYLCRNERQTIPWAFKPHSLIVLAGRQGWWPGAGDAQRLRRLLEAAGHFVVLVGGAGNQE